MRENKVEDFSKMFEVTDACLYDCCTMYIYYICIVIVFDKKILQISVKREINWIQQQSSPGFEEGGVAHAQYFPILKRVGSS